MSTAFNILYCTCPDRETGERIARALVEARLAACVNVVPGLTSFYRWEGAVQADTEVLLLIKAAAEQFEAVDAAIRKLHPYDVPEVIAAPITTGNPAYLAWLHSESGAP